MPCASYRISKPAGSNAVVLKFVGPTPSAAVPEFLAELTRSMPESEAVLVFDLTELEGYNPETKEPIKAWLREHKLAIRQIVVLVQKSRTILKMATAAVSLAVGIKITIREQLDGAESALDIAGP